jgi:hypothetical protein
VAQKEQTKPLTVALIVSALAALAIIENTAAVSKSFLIISSLEL